MILRRILAGLAAGTVVLALGASTAQADPATMSSDPRIIGGSNARITEVPWQVALLRAGSGSGLDRQFCGGSILSAEWILTAAHCLAPDPRTSTVTDASAIIVTSGTDDLTAAGQRAEFQSNVRSIHLHPDYDADRLANDIALLRLETPLTLGATRRPIALPTQSDWPAQGASATISGWGQTGQSASTRTLRLQKASVAIIGAPSDSTCGQWESDVHYASAVMLCAGVPAGGISTCRGDSGGPLAVSVAGTPVLAGVTSWGNTECGKKGYPSVYARVTAFTSWITDTRQATPGSISVSVTSPTTLDAAVCAYAYGTRTDTSTAIAGGCGAAGARTATIPGLPPGSYRVLVTSKGPYAVPSWWAAGGRVQGRGDAGIVTVSAGLDTGLQTTLQMGGTIEVALSPVPRDLDSSVCLVAYPVGSDTSSSWACAAGNATSAVTLTRLAPGPHHVQLIDGGGVYPTQWYPAKAARTSALPVMVTAESATSITVNAAALVATLSGTVRNALGMPQAGIRLSLTDAAGIKATKYQSTGANGTYSFAVDPGVYRVALAPRPEDPYRAAASGPLTFDGSANITHDFTVLPGVTLTGKVTTLAGAPMPGALVQVHSPPSPVDPSRPTLIMEMPTAADGTYAFRSLPPRPVQVLVMGNPLSRVRYTPEWYWNTQDRAQAQTIDLSSRPSFAMGTTTLEAVSGTPGTLAGRVRGNYSPGGLSGIEVRLTTEDGGTVLRTATTDGSGDYTISGISPGNYGVDVVPGPSSPYLPSIGDIVTIIGGGTSTRNYTLERGGAVGGFVKDAQGNPLAGITVEARIFMYSDTITVARGVTDSTGSYFLAALPTDREVTFYFTATDLSTYYLAQWYGGSSTLANAQYVTPLDGQTLSLGDTVMTPGSSATGTIRGSVLNSGRNAIANATVTAHSAGGGFLAAASTDEDGVYVITGLPPGPVYLQAVDDTEAYPGFIPEWYLDADSLGTATPFTVVGDQVSTVDDIVTAEGVAFRGAVSDYDTDAPVGGVVHVVEAQGRTYTTQVVNGRYNIGGLPPGTYSVYVSPVGGYLPMWWDEAATPAQAVVVVAEAYDYFTADFEVSKTPHQPIITSVVKGARKQRVVVVTWEATVGAATYQLQRAHGNRWKGAGSTPALTSTDVLPVGLAWANSACYRVRAVSTAGALGPWSPRECTA